MGIRNVLERFRYVGSLRIVDKKRRKCRLATAGGAIGGFVTGIGAGVGVANLGAVIAANTRGSAAALGLLLWLVGVMMQFGIYFQHRRLSTT